MRLLMRNRRRQRRHVKGVTLRNLSPELAAVIERTRSSSASCSPGSRGGRREKNEQDLRTFLASPRVQTVAVDEHTAQRYAVILDFLWRAGTPIPTNDIWIAAGAMQQGLHVLTTGAHYERVPHVMTTQFDI